MASVSCCNTILVPLQGHPYRNVCDLRRGSSTSLISVEFASHSAEESHSNTRVPSGLPYSVLKARLSELDFIFLNRFVQEVLQYVSVLLVLQPAPIQNQDQRADVPALATAKAAGAEAVEEADRQTVGSSSAAAATQAPAVEGAQEVGMVLQMDIDMEAPVISMPRNSDSQDCVQLDLGSFSLRNSLKWIGGSSTSDPKVSLVSVTVLIVVLGILTASQTTRCSLLVSSPACLCMFAVAVCVLVRIQGPKA